MTPTFLIDFYKASHHLQYPSGISRIWTNWTPRSSRRATRNGQHHFGVQYLCKRYLQEAFREHFFQQPLGSVLVEYADVLEATLGVRPGTAHIAALHGVGFLPIEIYSLPEGTFVPSGWPALPPRPASDSCLSTRSGLRPAGN